MKDKTKEVQIKCFRSFKEGLLAAQKPVLEYLSTFTLEQLKDEEMQKEHISCMSLYSHLRGLAEGIDAMIEVLEAPPKPKDTEAISNFGFMSSEKKAA